MATMDKIKAGLIELKFNPYVMALRSTRKSLIDIYPAMRLRFDTGARQSLIQELKECLSVEDCMAFTRKHMGVGSCQILSEIESALNMLAESGPRVLCEIGTYDGGTSLLFSRFLPTLQLLFGIDLYVKNKEILKLLAPPAQKMHFLDRPSYTESTVQIVKRILAGRMIDILFIDGDHRYEGVKQDFLYYRSLVREGGFILFHDIMESPEGGRAWAGGVPQFWKELAAIYPHREFVNSRDQHGFGIGVLTYSKDVALPASLVGQSEAA